MIEGIINFVLFKNKFIRSAITFLRMIYFIKVQNKMQSFTKNPIDNSPYTLESNKRRVIPNENLPKHPRAKVFAGLDLDVSGMRLGHKKLTQ